LRQLAAERTPRKNADAAADWCCRGAVMTNTRQTLNRANTADGTKPLMALIATPSTVNTLTAKGRPSGAYTAGAG
jgi:hypothetical protein